MRSDARVYSSGLGSLKPEIDVAFAAIQMAIQKKYGKEQARVLALDQVAKISSMVKIALAERDRSEADKRLLEAKLRALTEAARRIPSA